MDPPAREAAEHRRRHAARSVHADQQRHPWWRSDEQTVHEFEVGGPRRRVEVTTHRSEAVDHHQHRPGRGGLER